MAEDRTCLEFQHCEHFTSCLKNPQSCFKKIVVTQVSVTRCCLQDGHVEGAGTHIIEQHLLFVVSFFVQSVGDRSRYLIR